MENNLLIYSLARPLRAIDGELTNFCLPYYDSFADLAAVGQRADKIDDQLCAG